jgi:hypothetical protein
LVLSEAKHAKAALSRAQLVEATGCSIFTVGNTTQDLVKRGLLGKQRIGGLNYFTLPGVVEAPRDSTATSMNVTPEVL